MTSRPFGGGPHCEFVEQKGGGGVQGSGRQPPWPWLQLGSAVVPTGHMPPSIVGLVHAGGAPPQQGWTQSSPVWQRTLPHAYGPDASVPESVEGASLAASAEASLPPSDESRVVPPQATTRKRAGERSVQRFMRVTLANRVPDKCPEKRGATVPFCADYEPSMQSSTVLMMSSFELGPALKRIPVRPGVSPTLTLAV